VIHVNDEIAPLLLADIAEEDRGRPQLSGALVVACHGPRLLREAAGILRCTIVLYHGGLTAGRGSTL